MRFPQTIGDDHPRPAISAVQATLSVADHVSGRSFPSATPVPCGPRNMGQLSSPRAVVIPPRLMTMSHVQRTRLRMLLIFDPPSSILDQHRATTPIAESPPGPVRSPAAGLPAKFFLLRTLLRRKRGAALQSPPVRGGAAECRCRP